MSIEVLWDELNILKIEKKDNLFVSSVNIENLITAKENGFPVFLLKQISTVSDELPFIVRNRIGGIKNRLKFKDDLSENEMEEDIYDYINLTGCRRPIDKFSINIQVN